MIPRPLLCLLSAAGAVAQDPPTVQGQVPPAPQAARPETNAPPAARPQALLDAWMMRLLEGRTAESRTALDKLLRDRKQFGSASDLALFALLETSFDKKQRRALRNELEKRLLRGPRGLPVATLDRLLDMRQRIEKARASGDLETLRKIRAELQEQVAKVPALQAPRTYLRPEVERQQREPNSKQDPQLEKLREQLAQADQRGDKQQTAALLHQIRIYRYNRYRSATARIRAKRHAEVTRLHLSARHQQGAEMEQAFISRRTRYRFERLSDWLAKQDQAELDKLLRSVTGNLNTWIEAGQVPDRRQNRKRDLVSEEREMLIALRSRLEGLAPNQIRSALILVGRTPYRRYLFPPEAFSTR